MSNSGLLVVTHAPLGNALLQVASHILGASPDFLKVLDILPTAAQEIIVDKGLLLLKQLDQHEGVVILSDCKGSTPGNIAEQLHSISFNSSLVYGLNLPMLLRAINYCGQSHHAVADAAVAGGRKSIIESEIRHD
ncbi:MAG: PTS fructose transporter subunit IIA [Gammaproteobacteria bacterium]|nr:PTS fructose transporter subunit IIA [Gammaproteobacteria bacterium]